MQASHGGCIRRGPSFLSPLRGGLRFKQSRSILGIRSAFLDRVFLANLLANHAARPKKRPREMDYPARPRMIAQDQSFSTPLFFAVQVAI